MRISPIYESLESLRPRWGDLAGMAVALDFGDPALEQSRAETLALADLSALPRLTVKGPRAAAFLTAQGLAVPETVYAVQPLPDGGLLIRTGGAEFFLEDGFRGSTVAATAQALGRGGSGVYPVLRQDASFALCGRLALEVLAQTCALNFQEIGEAFALTRIAGVSTGVYPRLLNGWPVYQLWTDGSYGPYLWEQLLTIARELDGGVIGIAGFLPEMSRQ